MQSTLNELRSNIDVHFDDWYKDILGLAIVFLDHLISELATRFSHEDLEIYCGFDLFPKQVIAINSLRVNAKKFCSEYQDDLPSYDNLYANGK